MYKVSLHAVIVALVKYSCLQRKQAEQKPLCVLSRIILASTKPGAWILDPFTGSSTTGIASNLLGRRFLGIDKESEYLEISKARKHEIEDLRTFSSYRKKVKDIALLDRTSLTPFAYDEECLGYDLPF